MADAAEAKPLPDEEPVEGSLQTDDTSVPDDSGDEKGNDVSFGTFLTVGPKQFRNVTIIGYDGLRDSVRAIRRTGDRVENIQIPYDQYKTLLDTQRESDLATGRKPKRAASKSVKGVFGRNVTIDGQQAQVIGFDAQTDEVLVTGAQGNRWLKSADILRSAPSPASGVRATVEATEKIADQTAKPEAVRIVAEQGGDIDEDKTAQIKRAFEEGRIKVNDPPGQKTVGVSVDTNGRILRQVELSSGSIEPARIDYVSRRGEMIALDDIDVAIPEITAPLEVEVDASAAAFQVSTRVEAPVSSIRAARQELQASRASAVPIQNAAAAIAPVAAAIPASNEAALAVVAAAKGALEAYDRSSAGRSEQINQLQNQIRGLGDRIATLQQRSRTALASGNGAQAAQFERQISSSQSERAALLAQQTDLQVARINESNRAEQLVQAVQELAPDESGNIAETKIVAVQTLLPRQRTIQPPQATRAERALAEAVKPAQPSRAFTASIPLRPAAARAPGRSLRSPKPLRPLGDRLASLGGTPAGRAVDFNAAQQADRAAGQNGFGPAGAEQALGQDAYEAAFMTEGGQAGYSGPLDIPERKTQTYAAGAEGEEFEAPDIYGAAEEEGRRRQAELNRSLLVQESETIAAGPGQIPPPSRPREESVQMRVPRPVSGPETGPQPTDVARAAAFQQAIAQAVLEDSQRQEQGSAASAAEKAEQLKKQIDSTKRAISNLVDAFDAIHGAADVIGLLLTFAHINLRLTLTIFKTDLPLTPRAGYPLECTVFGCLDLMICINILAVMMISIAFVAAIIAAVSGATFGLAELVDLF